jgi:hypothetical protein
MKDQAQFQSRTMEPGHLHAGNGSVQPRCAHRGRSTLYVNPFEPKTSDAYARLLQSSLCPECCDWSTNPRMNEALASGTYAVVTAIEAVLVGIGTCLARIGALVRTAVARRPAAMEKGKQPVAA